MEQKIEKTFFVLQIIAFELRVADSHNIEQDTCHQMSMSLQTSLRFYLTLGDIFSKSTSLRMTKKHDKSPLMDKSQVFRDAFTCSLPKRVLKRRFLESGLPKIFRVCNFGNTLAITIILFFKMFKI